MQWISPALAAGYGLTALASYVLPGPDMALIVPRAMTSRRLGMATAAGTQTGLLVHGGLAIAGVGALIVARPGLLGVLQLLGGLYLLWLGTSDVRAGLRPAGRDSPVARPATRLSAAYFAGLGVNVLNPKAVLFFVAILPQFVPTGAAPVGTISQLAALDLLIGFGVWTVVVLLCAKLSAAADRQQSQRFSGLFMGGILIILGAVFVARALC